MAKKPKAPNKNDNLSGRSGADLMDGGEGNDRMNGGAGGDTLAGGIGDDRLVGGAGNDWLDGGGSIVNGVLSGIDGSDGNDRVNGDAGNDTLVYRAAGNQGMRDQYDGGSGWDTLRLELSGADFGLYLADIADLMGFLSTTKRDGKGEVAGSHGRYLLEMGTGQLQINKIEGVEVIVDGQSQNVPIAPAFYRGDAKAEVTEGGPLVDTGRLPFLDLNLTDSHTVTAALVGADPALGSLSVSVLDASTGDGLGQVAWTYTLDDTLVQGLGAQDEVEQVYLITLTDSAGLVTTHEFKVEVLGINDPPLAADDAFATLKNTALVVAAPGVLGNDSDVDGDLLSVASVETTGLAGTLATAPGGGFTFTPTVDFVGVTSFSYALSDGAGGLDTGLVTITVG